MATQPRRQDNDGSSTSAKATADRDGSDVPSGSRQAEQEEEDDSGEEEDEEDEEPKLKYVRITSSLGNIYRNGDATSSFITAGDKMIVGTHNGNIHILSLPSFQSLKVYHAHSASVTAVSISPFPPPLPNPKSDAAALRNAAAQQGATNTASSSSPPSPNTKNQRQRVIPATVSNTIHIATSSIDGNVCVASLIDPKDVLSRNFGRPVQAVALSPAYKNDRTYLSGGLAGNLVLTIGGKAGTSSTSNTAGGAAASASGWLGAIGIGPNTSKDTVLHSGEGAISVIKWSRSGKYVVWINEHGIKIMRSHLHLGSEDLDSAWKRISHIDRPSGSSWDEMSAVWKGKAEWINEDGLETDDSYDVQLTTRPSSSSKGSKAVTTSNKAKRKKIEKLVVGWGGTVWIINVFPEGLGVGKNVGERSLGHAEIANVLKTGCVISGLTLYTPTLLVILAYVLPEAKPSQPSLNTTPKRGVHHRKDALSPELQIIDITSSEEISSDALTVSRYESLSATDYHLSILPSVREAAYHERQRGALEYVGGSLLTAGAYATSLFSSGASIRAGSRKSDNGSEKGQKASSGSSVSRLNTSMEQVRIPHPNAAGPGMKLYIHSPYDCVLATKRDIGDHLQWLLSQKMYGEAWILVNDHPEVAGVTEEAASDSVPSTPKRGQTTGSEDVSVDDASVTSQSLKSLYSSSEKEKRRIGELWLQQLIDSNDWNAAGAVAGKVLNTSNRWDHWFWIFAKANKLDAVAPFLPTFQLTPPLPSLIYEVVLGRYIASDRLQLKKYLEQWPPELFDIRSVTTSLQGKLKSEEIREDTVEDGQKGRDWRIVMEGLAKLFVADGRPREGLRCYIKLKDSDQAMSLIREYHLLDAIADDIPGLIMLKVSREQMQTASISKLEELTAEPIALIVKEALHGIVRPENVVSQLEKSGKYLFLFFYLRSLWKGETVVKETRTTEQALEESRNIVQEFGDTAVELFAEYDRPLLMQFLKTSQSYTFESALAVCERQSYIDEQVFLLSKTGQTKRALYLIIDSLHDVSGAIAFAKQQDDPELWDDFLNYSMDKPKFVRGLLEGVGTAIDPITLVRKIPDKLEVEGLKDGLTRMIREFEIQYSICEGVANVFRGEVSDGLNQLRMKQKQGVRFDVSPVNSKSEKAIPSTVEQSSTRKVDKNLKLKPGHCAGCGRRFSNSEQEPLVGFNCGHMFHITCLLLYEDRPSDLPPSIYSDGDQDSSNSSNIRNRVTYAQLIQNMIDDGCPLPVHAEE